MSNRHPRDDEPELSIWKELGLPEPQSHDESAAPPVDRALMLAVIRKEVQKNTAKAVYELIHRYRSWRDAHAQLIVEEHHRTSGGGAEAIE